MSLERRHRRQIDRRKMVVTAKLANLLGYFYEFLGRADKPSDQEVRDMFTECDKNWRAYCRYNKLIKMEDLFVINVHEAWHRHDETRTE